MAHYSPRPCDKVDAHCCCGGRIWVDAEDCTINWMTFNFRLSSTSNQSYVDSVKVVHQDTNGEVHYYYDMPSGSILYAHDERMAGTWTLFAKCSSAMGDSQYIKIGETQVTDFEACPEPEQCEWMMAVTIELPGVLAIKGGTFIYNGCTGQAPGKPEYVYYTGADTVWTQTGTENSPCFGRRVCTRYDADADVFDIGTGFIVNDQFGSGCYNPMALSIFPGIPWDFAAELNYRADTGSFSIGIGNGNTFVHYGSWFSWMWWERKTQKERCRSMNLGWAYDRDPRMILHSHRPYRGRLKSGSVLLDIPQFKFPWRNPNNNDSGEFIGPILRGRMSWETISGGPWP
jgi:hypothetical protein